MELGSKTLTLVVTVVAFLQPGHGQVQSEFSSSRFQKIAAEGVVFSAAAANFTSGSRSKCAAICSLRRQCLSYSYQSSSGRCLVFHRRVFYGIQMTTAATHFQHYWKMKGRVLPPCLRDYLLSLQFHHCLKRKGRVSQSVKHFYAALASLSALLEDES